MNTSVESARFGVDFCRVADYMFDTAFFIDLRRSNSEAATILWKAIEEGSASASYSAVTAYELWVGRSFGREEEVFYRAVFALLDEAPTAAAAMSAGSRLRDSGNRTEKLFRDALIAACAAERDEVVVTRNVRDFE